MSTRRLRRSKNYPSFIGNLDETPLWLDMPGDTTTRESIRRDTTALATATDSELDESDPFKDVEEDEDELEENKLIHLRTANLLYYGFL